jgi:hypothetical protein
MLQFFAIDFTVAVQVHRFKDAPKLLFGAFEEELEFGELNKTIPGGVDGIEDFAQVGIFERFC